MVEVDRLMVEDYGIELIQMMENAGRCLAILAKTRFLTSPSTDEKVMVLAGTGGNGGGAMVCARRLSSWGWDVSLAVTNQDRLIPVPQLQFDILKRMEIPVVDVAHLEGVDQPSLIIDGVIGYNLSGSPRNEAKTMIEWANASSTAILALDTPSGIDLTSGTVYQPSIKADATLTLALPKKGLAEQHVKDVRGELYLADISVPPSLYSSPTLGLEVDSPFDQGDIVRID